MTTTSFRPVPAGFDLRAGAVRLATGPLVRYVEQGDQAAEPLILLHGYGDSWYSFSRLLSLLAPAEYHVFAFDQRGHGSSERPPDGYGMDDFSADVAAFMDAIGIARATVVGHSMGSLIARRVAAFYPERVSRLVLIGSALRTTNAVTRELRDVVQGLEDPVPADFVREFQASTIHAPLPDAFFEGVVAESLKVPARVWRAALAGILALDDAEAVATISAPTLILGGALDGVFSAEEQQELATAMPGSQLILYPETGHDPQWERPEQVARDLEVFLRSCGRRLV
jgi:pimeloyl-ACP methyl ester carboxylesterase